MAISGEMAYVGDFCRPWSLAFEGQSCSRIKADRTPPMNKHATSSLCASILSGTTNKPFATPIRFPDRAVYRLQLGGGTAIPGDHNLTLLSLLDGFHQTGQKEDLACNILTDYIAFPIKWG